VSPRVPRLNRDLQVSAEAISRACNSIAMKVPDGHDLSQYSDKWKCASQDGKGKSSCRITFKGVDDKEYNIRICCFFNEAGKAAKKLFLEPFHIGGKKVWIDNLILEEIRWQAKCAFQKHLAEG